MCQFPPRGSQPCPRAPPVPPQDSLGPWVFLTLSLEPGLNSQGPANPPLGPRPVPKVSQSIPSPESPSTTPGFLGPNQDLLTPFSTS